MKAAVKPKRIDGEDWYDYLYEYDWDGGMYSFKICARSIDEAEARLRRLPLARFAGVVGDEIPVTTTARVTTPLKVWWRNLDFG